MLKTNLEILQELKEWNEILSEQVFNTVKEYVKCVDHSKSQKLLSEYSKLYNKVLFTEYLIRFIEGDNV